MCVGGDGGDAWQLRSDQAELKLRHEAANDRAHHASKRVEADGQSSSKWSEDMQGLVTHFKPELSVKTGEMELAEANIEMLQRNTDTLHRELAAKTSQLLCCTTELQQLRSSVCSPTSGSTTQRQSQLQKAESDLHATTEALMTTTIQLESATTKLDVMSCELRDTKRRLRTADQDVAAKRTEVDYLMAERHELGVQLELARVERTEVSRPLASMGYDNHSTPNTNADSPSSAERALSEASTDGLDDHRSIKLLVADAAAMRDLSQLLRRRSLTVDARQGKRQPSVDSQDESRLELLSNNINKECPFETKVLGR